MDAHHRDRVRISAVICTYRRPEVLSLALQSLASQTLSDRVYEIIVVDNNSQDQTRRVVERCAEDFAAEVRYVLERHQGLGHARNAGIRAARGEIIAYLDDDAEADPNWLAALLSAYDGMPNAWAVGGKVLPIWDAQRPDWLSDGLIPYLSLIDWGDQGHKLENHRHLAGANCSFRRNTFDVVGYFPTDLGRTRDSLLAGEEAELIRRMHRRGKAVYYVPHAVVYHHVPRQRMKKRYFRQRFFWSGWSRAIYDGRSYGMRYVLGEVARIALTLPARTLRAIGYLNPGDDMARAFQEEMEFRSGLGYIVGSARNLVSGRKGMR